MNSSGTKKRGKSVSINSESLLDIQPIVYSFKVPPHSQPSGSVITAPRPPQWLYHDHVMGVIWMIFHKDKNYVGITQLQWCLNFLLDLKNSQGEYTGDVEICIQAIQDNLIEQYAKLGPALEKSIKEKSTVEAKNEDSTVHEENEAKPDITIFHEEEYEDLTLPDIAGIIGTSTPKEEDSETWMHEKKQITKKNGKYCGEKCASADTSKKKEEMVSFTYNDMVSRGSKPCKEPYLFEDTYSDQQSVEPAEPEQVNLENLNTSNLRDFLNTTKQQHIERINKEMDTLRILERFLENLNISSASPTAIEDLKKSLVNLQTENSTKEAEEIEKVNK